MLESLRYAYGTKVIIWRLNKVVYGFKHEIMPRIPRQPFYDNV